MPLTNGPFRTFLTSIDGGLTLSWKILDGSGRVHVEGRSKMPDFVGGGGMILTAHLEIADGEVLNKRLESLPVDRAVVEQRLGKRFTDALEAASD